MVILSDISGFVAGFIQLMRASGKQRTCFVVILGKTHLEKSRLHFHLLSVFRI